MISKLFAVVAALFFLIISGCGHSPNQYDRDKSPLAGCAPIPEETHMKVRRNGTQCTYTTDTIVECDRGGGKKERLPVQFEEINTCTETEQATLK